MARASGAKGLVAEFETVDELISAIREMRRLGYRDLDAHMPYPSKEVIDALELRKSRVPLLVLLGGLTGIAAGYLIPWWTNAVDYPINIGGRPDNAVPAFIPLVFETGVLLAATFGFFGFLALCRLPRLWHPVMEVPGFHRTTTDRFWLRVDAADEEFRLDRTQEHLMRFEPLRIEQYGELQ